MNDPVDTDALREYIATHAISPAVIRRVGAAADEVDRLRGGLEQAQQDVTNAENDGIGWMDRANRLRTAIENAPHADTCPARFPMHFHAPWPCSCWKADAL